MSDGGPDPKNPLAPYYPSETPGVPGNGRKWAALFLALLLLTGAAYGLLSMVVG